MRMFVKTVIVGVLICFANVCLEAQQFELNRHGEVRQLDYNKDWYVVQRLGSEDECCNSRRYLGQIFELSQDSIHIKIRQFESRNVDEEKFYYSKMQFNKKKEFPIYKIAKADLKDIQEKQSSLNKVFTVVGVVLLFTSAATAIHAMIVDDDDRKALFLSAGIQIGASIALISIGNIKKEKYIIHENAWQF